jgi:hypothetical protein
LGEERKLYKVLVRKLKGKRSLGRPRCRWKNGIRMDLWEVGWGGVEWIQLVQDRNWCLALVNAMMNLQVLVARN